MKANRIRAIKQDVFNWVSARKPISKNFTYKNDCNLEPVGYLIDKEPKAYAFFSYDSSGKLVEKTYKEMVSVTKSKDFVSFEPAKDIKWKYQYDSVSQLLQRIVYISKMHNYQIDSVFYNPKKIKTTLFSLNKVFAIDTKFYDKYYNIVEVQIQHFDTDSTTFTLSLVNKYNKKNKLIKTIEGKGEIQYDYMYYDNGLLKLKTCKNCFQSFILTYKCY